MLEKINEFFDKRVETYDQHQLNDIEGAREFYPFSANLLPKDKKVNILDVGCGTCLELEYYDNKLAHIDGIDCAKKMLTRGKEKMVDRDINFICEDIFKHHYGTEVYDAIICVETLHHYNKAQKTLLYMKLFESLKNKGFLILTDYFAKDNIEEAECRNKLVEIIHKDNLDKSYFYHIDTPFTLEHEIYCLQQAGFEVEILKTWGQTSCLKCIKK